MPPLRPPALRLLYLAANPTPHAQLRLDREIRVIERKIRDSPHRDRIAVDACWATSADDLQGVLLDRSPHIIHFSGHGEPGGVVLESPLRGVGVAGPEALAVLLRIANRDVHRVRAIVLNACHSAAQLERLCEVVDCAIGMSAGIPDDVAISFSAAFYQAVSSGRSLQDAFMLAKARLQIECPEYSHVPQIRARGGVRLADLVLLPPAGSLLDAPGRVDNSGRWLTGHALKAGDPLAEGRFVLQEWLGQGTFATVWRAQESATGRQVALKILHERFNGDLVIHDRFFRGARLMSQFRHPAIVEVLDPCVVWHGYRFFVMDYVRGRTLMDYVLEHRLTWREVITYGLEIGAALAYAHERSCIHRDIKPANILVDGSGHAKLFDFDLVRDLYVEGGTRPGAMGTVAYAAPEALDRPQDADGRADEYSLAITLAAAIAGREPTRHDKRTPEVFIDHLPCPREIREVLRHAAAWEPQERYSSMLGFCAALQDAVARCDRHVRRRRLALRTAWMSAGGLGLGLGLGYAIWTANSGTPAAAPTDAAPRSRPAPTRDARTSGAPAATPVVGAVDRARTRYAIRVSADNTLAEAEADARTVRATSDFDPWVVHELFPTRGVHLYRVYVGDYPSEQTAQDDRPRARSVLGQGAEVVALARECPVLRLTSAGYHECDDAARR
jgi:hypothetical protein